MAEGNNGTRLVRVSEELFQTLMNTSTSEVEVEWGEPIETVAPIDGPPEYVYSPIIRRHFRADLDDDEVGDGDSWM